MWYCLLQSPTETEDRSPQRRVIRAAPEIKQFTPLVTPVRGKTHSPFYCILVGNKEAVQLGVNSLLDCKL